MNQEAKELLEDAKYWTSMTVTTLTKGNKENMAIDYANIVSEKLDAIQKTLQPATKRASRKKRSKKRKKK